MLISTVIAAGTAAAIAGHQLHDSTIASTVADRFGVAVTVPFTRRPHPTIGSSLESIR